LNERIMIIRWRRFASPQVKPSARVVNIGRELAGC
jgi:hypothetical protein